MFLRSLKELKGNADENTLSKVHLIIPDIHSHWEHDNARADLLSKLVIDLQPDVVINMGDQWDMPSLSSYDKGLRSFQGRTYAADIASGCEFSDRLWGPVKRRKRKLPLRVFLHGNHENRIEKALQLSPELEGTINFSDLSLDTNYDIVVPYTGKNTPGIIELDGVTYAHYLVSGIMGRPVGGEHPAYSLISKSFTSCTVAHSHLLDFCIRTMPDGGRVMGLVAGCMVDYKSDWAGETQKLWWPGVIVCRNVNDGQYDPEMITLERLRKIYG